MSKAPQFPFYVRDWLCSRTVLSMSGDAAKAYVYLLSESWLQIPRATLPINDIELASMARISTDKWMSIKCDVLRCFSEGKCDEHKGRFYNEKLLEISRKYENNQRVNNKNAKRTRKNAKRTRRLDNDNDNDNDNESVVSSVIVERDVGKTKIEVPEHLKELWPDFLEIRKKKRAPNTARAIKLCLSKLEKLAVGNHVVQIKIVEQAIECGYQTFWPLKENTTKSPFQIPGRTYQDL